MAARGCVRLDLQGAPGMAPRMPDPEPGFVRVTSRDRRPVGTLTFQPIVLRHLWGGLYARSGDATWALDWRNGSSATVPLSFGLGYVLVRPGYSPVNFL